MKFYIDDTEFDCPEAHILGLVLRRVAGLKGGEIIYRESTGIPVAPEDRIDLRQEEPVKFETFGYGLSTAVTSAGTWTVGEDRGEFDGPVLGGAFWDRVQTQLWSGIWFPYIPQQDANLKWPQGDDESTEIRPRENAEFEGDVYGIEDE